MYLNGKVIEELDYPEMSKPATFWEKSCCSAKTIRQTRTGIMATIVTGMSCPTRTIEAMMSISTTMMRGAISYPRQRECPILSSTAGRLMTKRQDSTICVKDIMNRL